MGNATRKQIDALRKMGYAVAEDISFEEAHALFEKHKLMKPLPANAPKIQPEAPKPEKQGYHLTPEQVRTNAVEAAQRWYPKLADDLMEIEHFWFCVRTFEKYIAG